MTLIKPSFGIAALSGKLGGAVYARNRGGLYARAWADPSQPDSPDQVNKMEIWQNAGTAFRSLTVDDLNIWRNYAQRLTAQNRLGDPIQLTAQQVFYELYTNATLAGLDPLTLPTETTNRPAWLTYSEFEATTNFGDLGRLRIRDPIAITASGYTPIALIQTAPIQRATVRNVNNQFRFTTVQEVAGSDLELKDGYEAKFGTAAESGHLAHARLRIIDSHSMLGGTWVLFTTKVLG